MDQQDTPQQLNEAKPILVIDTNAFIRCLDIHKLIEKYEVITSNNVLMEIRDKVARDKYTALGYDIRTSSADTPSFDFVDNFSKKTGDFFSLSYTDKELIAIAVTQARQRGNGDKLRKMPPELTEWIPGAKKSEYDHNEEEYSEEEEEEEEAPAVDDDGFVTVTKGKVLTEADVTKNKKKKAQAPKVEETEEKEVEQKEEVAEGENKEGEKAENEEVREPIEGVVLERVIEENNAEKKAEGELDVADDSSDEDDGKDWINADNINKIFYKSNRKDDQIKEIGVTLMTADYAMQNVAIQIGIPLISTEGYLIRQTRRFVLECYCCRKVCKDNTKQFCPSCGNPTLTKLSCRVNNDGTMTYFRNPRKKISTRGKIYSIPKAEGGRNSKDLLLREDEFLMRGRLQAMERQEKEKDKKFKQRLKDYENGLTFDDITLKHKYNANKLEIGYGKINPNDRMQFRKKK